MSVCVFVSVAAVLSAAAAAVLATRAVVAPIRNNTAGFVCVFFCSEI